MTAKKKSENKSDESWGYLLVTAAVGIGLYAALKKKDTLPEATAKATASIVTPKSSSPSSSRSSTTFPLSKGSRGNLVTSLQNLLLKLGDKPAAEIKASGGVDGIFGSGTEKALLEAGFSKIVTQSDYEKLSQMVQKQGATVVKGDTEVYVFVDSFFLDEPIYKNVVKEDRYFHGTKINVTEPKELITKLPHRMYIGKATGKAVGKFIQVKATLNGIDYFVWVDKGETTVEIFKEADLHNYLSLRKGQQKTREVINNMIAAFA